MLRLLAGGGALAFEVFEGAGHALFEGRERLPAEVDRSAAGIEGAALDLAGARWGVLRGLLEPRELGHHVEELLHARLDTRADVQHESAALVDRTHERVDDIVDIDVVARLRAVTEDQRTLAVEQPAREDRDHARLAVRILARAVHVR